MIRTLAERLGWVGRIVTAFIGLAWSVTTVFAIPVLVMEPVLNPLTVLRTSATTIKKTWGESLVGYLDFQIGGVIALASLALLSAVFAAAAVSNTSLVFAAGGVIWLVTFLGFAYVMGVASRVFQCGLYLYASEGTVPAPFDQGMLNAAWKVKAR